MKKQISPKIVSFTRLNSAKGNLTGLIFSVLVICFAIAFYAFAVWQEPTLPQPGGNVPPPLNTSSQAQVKIGGLMLNTHGYPNGLIVDRGNVGIGTPEPSQKLDVVGYVKGRTGLCIGNDCRTSWPAGGGGAFGSWTNKNSAGGTLVKNAVYKATSDGFVLAMVLSTGTEHIIYGYTDSIDAKTLVIVGKTSRSGPNGYGGITMPVRKGDYWKVTHPATVIIRWLPIGSGVCEKQ